jgi:type I restriction-modification system DNA methylase subunit
MTYALIRESEGWIKNEKIDYKIVLILFLLKKISDTWEKEFEEAYKEAFKVGLS